MENYTLINFLASPLKKRKAKEKKRQRRHTEKNIVPTCHFWVCLNKVFGSFGEKSYFPDQFS